MVSFSLRHLFIEIYLVTGRMTHKTGSSPFFLLPVDSYVAMRTIALCTLILSHKMWITILSLFGLMQTFSIQTASSSWERYLLL